MKFSVSALQPRKVLEAADEIYLFEENKDSLADYLIRFPDKTIVQRTSNIKAFPLLHLVEENSNLVFQVSNEEDCKTCMEQNIPYFYEFPVCDWETLNALAALKPQSIRITSPLTFQLRDIKRKYDIPLRVCPLFRSRYGGITGLNPCNSFWVRPEDIALYEEYVDTFEFWGTYSKEQATYFDVYKSGSWPGNLNLCCQ